MKEKKSTRTWLIVGAFILIALLMLWLTFADLAGDTDVSARVDTVASSVFIV